MQQTALHPIGAIVSVMTNNDGVGINLPICPKPIPSPSLLLLVLVVLMGTAKLMTGAAERAAPNDDDWKEVDTMGHS